MDTILIIFLLILIVYSLNSQLETGSIISHIEDTSSHVKPEHLLYDVLQKYSSGDKINLVGNCNVNLYTKHIIDVTMKQKFTKLLNEIFKSVYGITHKLFQVQELNNIYEQIDKFNNKRYIVDATLHSVTNYYTVKVILDIVVINDEPMVNYISVNDASNNNIIDRYDIVYQDQGILLNHNNFTENIRSLLDTEYKDRYHVISINSKDNYRLENVLSLNSLLKNYFPATLSYKSQENLKMKGVDGLLEMYFPSNMNTAKSPQFCSKHLGENCVFNQSSTQTEYNQPYMGPGLFFNRSSYPKQGY
jgi:hypothetical protein